MLVTMWVYEIHRYLVRQTAGHLGRRFGKDRRGKRRTRIRAGRAILGGLQTGAALTLQIPLGVAGLHYILPINRIVLPIRFAPDSIGGGSTVRAAPIKMNLFLFNLSLIK